MRARCVILAHVLVVAACGGGGRDAIPVEVEWQDPAPHSSGFVVANGVRLHYLDWGGSGPTLILIHGFGDSPHVFDDLAPAFTDRYRVIAYARRGHGRSESRGPYDGTTMVEDLRGLMDSLGIARASLAGWSLGGNEITRLAGTYPERVDRVVYLDAAYDWSEFGEGLASFPVPFDPDSAALGSIDAWRRWYLGVWFPGIDPQGLEAHLRDVVRELPGGAGVEPVPTPAASAAIAETYLLADRREYGKVRVPALAIYSTHFLSTLAGDSARIAAWEKEVVVPFREASKTRIRRELHQVEILDVPGSHADFVFRSRDLVVRAMRRFLEGASAN